MTQMNLSMKQEQAHRHREQTCGCQGWGEGWTGSLGLADATIICVSCTQSCLTLCNPMKLPGSSVHSILQQELEGCHFLLQGIFPTEGLNPGLPYSRQVLYHLSHQGRPKLLYTEWMNNIIYHR